MMTRMRERLQSLAYASKLYQMMISGPAPKALHAIPADPWPGDAACGQAILDGFFAAGGQRFSAYPPLWLPGGACVSWMNYAHSFTWLRDLRALGGDTARRVARSLLSSWMDEFEYWTAKVWEPRLIADRMTHVIGLHEFALASAEGDFRARIFEMLVRHAKHLQRITPSAVGGLLKEPATAGDEQLYFTNAVQGVDLLKIMRGLVFAGVALPDGEKALQLGMQLLPLALRQSFSADGSVAERNPSAQMQALKCLIDVRQALKVSHIGLPPELPIALERAATALRFFRHGDSALALFNGGREEYNVLIDALLTQADVRGRAPKSLPQGGYERLSMGRTLVLIDVGAAPPAGLDRHAHAGLASFEYSLGRERVFVNCGAPPSDAIDDWHFAMAGTAAHTGLTLMERNSAEILESGGIGRRAKLVEVNRLDQSGQLYVEINHDAYLLHFKTKHQRCLTLCEGGDALRGIDRLFGPPGLDFAIRFHLHPDVQAGLIQNNSAVLLRLSSGSGLRLKSERANFELQESLYYGRAAPRRSQQIVLKGVTGEGQSEIAWVVQREKK